MFARHALLDAQHVPRTQQTLVRLALQGSHLHQLIVAPQRHLIFKELLVKIPAIQDFTHLVMFAQVY